jgi:transposase
MPVDDLPDDVAALRGMLIAEREARAAQAVELDAAKAGLVSKTLEIEKLKVQLARLRRQQFGRSSEKIDRIIEQLELMLDELETEAAVGPVAAASSAAADDDESVAVRRKSPGRRPLPEHLPRREIVHTPDCTCPACGSAMRKVGEDVSEVLDYIPGRFEVIRHIRPAFSCRRCESMAQMPMPSLPVERGRPSAALLAHILVSKYCDHTPLYRQAGIYARAKLSWSMVLDTHRRVADSIELHDSAAKMGGGRTIPLHPDLRRALQGLRRTTGIEGAVIRSERRGSRGMSPSSIVN